DQHQVAIAFELVAGIGHPPALGRVNLGALRHGDVDPVIVAAVGPFAEGGNEAAACRPAKVAGSGTRLRRGLSCVVAAVGKGGRLALHRRRIENAGVTNTPRPTGWQTGW